MTRIDKSVESTSVPTPLNYDAIDDRFDDPGEVVTGDDVSTVKKARTSFCRKKSNTDKFYRPRMMKMHLDDPMMLGSNYQDYDNNVGLDKLEIKITKMKKKGYQPGGDGPNIPMPANWNFSH